MTIRISERVYEAVLSLSGPMWKDQSKGSRPISKSAAARNRPPVTVFKQIYRFLVYIGCQVCFTLRVLRLDPSNNR